MLRKLRLTMAAVSFTLITLLFLDFSGTLHAWLGWLAKIQFVPAILALNVGVVLFLVLLTLILGRVYCSVICPLGILQDLSARAGRIGKKLPYSYSPAKRWLRYGFLALFVVAIAAGISVIVALLDPYAAYGRIANNFFLPVWQWGNNLLASAAERANSYTFYTVDVWVKSIPTLVVAAVTLVVVVVLAWKNGRTYCNTICPVGTLLGVLSRYSAFKIVIDESSCNSCGLCARHCKAACIDSKTHAIDYTRCVACMNCIGKCKKDALSFRYAYARKQAAPQQDTSNVCSANAAQEKRRGFLSAATLLMATSLKSQIIEKATDIKMDGGLADIIDKQAPKRQTPLTPPGSLNARNMKNSCTACQLCITACPNGVLRPSSQLETFMQPQMSYEKGYCRPECTICSEVCPAGAITKIGKDDKSAIQIGHAVWNKETCIPIADNQPCGNCERHCPTDAIVMIPSDANDPESLKVPAVNTERCIGCGACEHLCPSRPVSAIYVEGHELHKTI
ncbi:MAG: 4Fe-4S binding protein [Tannerellaceae bacterium]